MPEDNKPNEQTNEPDTTSSASPDPTPTTVEPVAETKPTEAPEVKKLSPGGLVLQWLTYAFWGWAALLLSWLVFLVLHTAFNRADSSYWSFDGLVPYALAGTIVLLIIALITDIFFKRIEPKEKQGASTVIMIIHAVIFAIFAIGWLIAGVFGIVVLLIGTGSDDGSGVLAQLSTSAVMVAVYGATLLRTLNPSKIPKVPILYWAFMGVVMLITIALAIVGPVAAQREALKDEPVERELKSLSSEINRYASAENKLPTLEEVKADASQDAQEMIDDGRITYTEKGKLEVRTLPSDSSDTRSVYRYELCGEFLTQKGNENEREMYDQYQTDAYDTQPAVEYHSKGKVCYELQTRSTY